MPQITHLRYCNVGPVGARIEDEILSFADSTTGKAVPTVIWLRNGGGKTVLLSLLLWLFGPGRSMPGNNRIEDFVLSSDHSVCVAEWQLDHTVHQPPEHYLTGVFCEWHTTA